MSPYHSTYSGFQDLDILTNGLPYGDLIVIAGRPSMGKTSLAIHIAYNVLIYFHINICIFSLEMTIIQVLHKLISIGSRISINSIFTNQLNINQWHIIQKICNELLKNKIYINDNSNINLNQIKFITNTITQIKENKKIIIIDYLQLIQVKDLNIENRTHELGHITRKLKILAQTLSIPIIILSQLNRSIENRLNKKPLLSDLKESGCVNYLVLINIDNFNTLSLTSIFNQYNSFTIKSYKGILNYKIDNFNIKNDYIKLIYILKRYNFKCQINQGIEIILTNNHQLLSNYQWIEQQQLEKNHKIVENKSSNQLHKMILRTIRFISYALVYDIVKKNYITFNCNNIVIHNSIEQDSDIIIMLSKNLYIKEEKKNTKTLDIFVSKNRNGPTGSFKLYFNPKNNFFSKHK